MFFGRSRAQPEAESKILLIILALVWNMGRIVHYDIKSAIGKRHVRVVPYDRGPMNRRNIQPDDFTFASVPESAAIYRSASRILFGFLCG